MENFLGVAAFAVASLKRFSSEAAVNEHQNAAPQPPPAPKCAICGSNATLATRHPSKEQHVIVDCMDCGGVSVVDLREPLPQRTS